MSSVENFLNRSYPRFASTTTTTTANIIVIWKMCDNNKQYNT